MSRKSEKILRTCVHCGFCTATCPTYVLLGDELDSPRGRIYLIKDMLENDRPATAEVVKHIDRCLSCLACMTTCPSGVHYMHLVDHARAHIEKTYRRPLLDRLLRALLAARAAGQSAGSALALRAGPARQAAGAVAATAIGLKRARRDAAAGAGDGCRPRRRPSGRTRFRGAGPAPRPGRAAGRLRQAGARALDQRGGDPPAHPPRHRGRGAEGAGLLRRARPPHGPRGRGARRGRANVDAWIAEIDGRGARRHPRHRLRLRHHGQGLRLHAAHRSGLCGQGGARLARSPWTSANIWRGSNLPHARRRAGLVVAYHAACSLQHGQKIVRRAEGIAFQVRLRGQRCAGRTSVLRLGRHLQHSAAGAREEAARPQGRRTSRSSSPT